MGMSDAYLGNPLLKRVNTPVELTQDNLIELAKSSEDPIYFAKNYIKIVTLNDGLVNFEPYPFQEEMLDNFYTKRFNICKLPRQPLCLNTPIPTTKGWKTIGELNLGEYVYSPNGSPVKIIKKSQIFYNTTCFKISFSSGEDIIADEKHQWLVSVNGIETVLETSRLYKLHKNGLDLFIDSAIIPSDYAITEYNNPIIKKHTIISIEKTESVPVACITVDSDEHLFVCGRNFIPTKNSGKSTTTVAFLIHNMLFEEHTSIAILANKAQTAKEILSRLQTAYENLPKWMQQGVKSCNKTSMELENGSKVIAASTSASAVRGGTYSLLMLDEYAFVPEQIANNFMRSVYPTISSGDKSKVIVVSCVTKDTYILTPEGYRRIECLIDETKKGAYFTNPYTVRGRDKFYSGNIIVNNGRTSTNIITTCYDSIECSEEHKLWAYHDGKFDYFKSKELQLGDYVALKYNNQVFGNNDYIDYYPKKDKSKNKFSCSQVNEDIAYFVGLFIAEGYARDIYSKKSNNLISGQVTITCADDISAYMNKLDINFKKYAGHYTITSKHLVGFLKELGFTVKKDALQKIIPDKVLSWSKNNITALLRGMFDGDGGVTERGVIYYTSTSRELIRQIQLLLANIGIIASVHKNVSPPTKKVKVFSTSYIIEIEGGFSYLYKKLIGFNIKRKKDRLDLINLDSIDIISDSASQLIKYGDENIIWLKIKDIQKSENEVYDVSLPDIEDDKWCHSVLYNNFLGHQTPQGMNHFYKLWVGAKKGTNEYHPFEIHWSDVPGRDEEWKRQQIANTSEKDFNQEFNTEFLGSSETLISGHKLSSVVTIRPIRTVDSLDVYEEPKENNIYVTLVDTAQGVEKDYHAFVIIDISNPPYKVVAKYRNNEIKPEIYSNIVRDIATVYNQSFVLCEVNEIGRQTAKDLIEDEYPNMLMCSTKSRSGQYIGQNLSGKFEYGVKMQKNTKKVGCIKLKTLIEENILIINDSDIFSELTTFVQKGSTFEAEAGRNDDLVMCLVIFAWLTTNQYFKDIVNIDLRKRLLSEKKEKEDADILPYGFSSLAEKEVIDEEKGVIWEVVDNDDMTSMLSIFNYY